MSKARTPAIRHAVSRDAEGIHAVINAAAEAYRGVIPDDCWHEPYMARDELESEIAAGVVFSVIDGETGLNAVMGIQDRGEVALIRHAYVSPTAQRRGLGAALLEAAMADLVKPCLIGTWAAATWAIRFYEKHGFEVVEPELKSTLLKRYWTVPERQIETSVVLADKRYCGVA